jgi:hypothetical protein
MNTIQAQTPLRIEESNLSNASDEKAMWKKIRSALGWPACIASPCCTSYCATRFGIAGRDLLLFGHLSWWRRADLSIHRQFLLALLDGAEICAQPKATIQPIQDIKAEIT